jgi:plastocyanin
MNKFLKLIVITSALIATGSALGQTLVDCSDFTIDATVTPPFPAESAIESGQVVKFVPTAIHNITSGTSTRPTSAFGAESGGNARCFQFKVAGEYPYYCSIHPSMQGKLVVK